MRHFSCIDNFDNLKALVKQDLRELGVKVPKNKKSKKHTGSKNLHSQNKEKDKGDQDEKRHVFGNYLSHVSCMHQADCGYVPRFLIDAAKLIIDNIEQEGLFRKSGSVSRQKDLQQQIEDGKELKDANVFDVTSLIKQFFRMLPEPLFTSVYHDAFVKCYQLGNSKDATHAILLLCLLLPGEHLSTLRFMMRLLSDIANCSEKNKMDENNLAVVLAPNMMHINSKSEMMKSSEEKLLQVQTSIVELLIHNAEDIGMVSDSLYDRALLMTEVFGTDDELDACEETLEESRDCKKKEKKRKRSGSFQGLVSSIAQSITKWRKSTDGRPGNTSTASNMSAYSNTSHAQPDQSTVSEVNVPNVPDMTQATPVVMRKRKASGDVLAFSATKKKAILQNLPNQAALANTPFTPASGMRKMNINDLKKKGNLDTPSISFSNNQVAFSATPCQGNKNMRKRLNLFSPASQRKTKKCSGSNISIQNTASKRSGKCKGLFRRLSGGKGDKPLPEHPEPVNTKKQVGHRLASPTGVSTGTNSKKPPHQTHKRSASDSPIAAIINNSVMSPTYVEQSVLSVNEEDGNDLNQGFILPEDEMDNSHISANSSNIDHHSLAPPRMCASDTAVNISSTNDSMYDKQQISMSSDMDVSKRMGGLRRGRPNSLKAGLLSGEERNVAKLRRSFGLDKSEISDPIPLYVPDSIQCLDSKTVLLGTESSNNKTNGEDDKESVVSDHKNGTTHDEVTVDKTVNSPENSEMVSSNSESNLVKENSKEQKVSSSSSEAKFHTSDSVDSLLRGQTGKSPETSENKKSLPRTVSSDSGKGSLFEESGVIDIQISGNETQSMETEEQSMETEKEPMEKNSEQNNAGKKGPRHYNSALSVELQPKISTSVSRSHSLHVIEGKRLPNITPNLQISMETHKLLSRAGYLPDSNSKDASMINEDVTVMAPPPPKIKHAEFNIPKRESIMFLQTNLAGKVADSVKHLEDDVADRHISPYRFPNSTSRKRGMSPIRIPTIFSKNEAEVAKIKDVVNINPRLGKGQAKLPISTQLLKPSEDAASKSTVPEKSKFLSRKPSIYYAKDNGKPPHRLNLKGSTLENVSDNSPTVGGEAMEISDNIQEKENQNSLTPKTPGAQYSDAQLSDSLTETIHDVCTPLCEKKTSHEVMDNKIPPKVPVIKQPVLTGNLKGRLMLRTPSGATPRQIIKNTSPHRSPVKHVKRLSSPGSPCRNTTRSRLKSTSPGKKQRSTLLSSIPHHLQDEINNID